MRCLFCSQAGGLSGQQSHAGRCALKRRRAPNLLMRQRFLGAPPRVVILGLVCQLPEDDYFSVFSIWPREFGARGVCPFA